VPYGTEQRDPTLISRVRELEKKVEELQARERNLTPRVAELETQVLRAESPIEPPPMS
jgi:uncharacterized protein YlxW (UPF0749 family)